MTARLGTLVGIVALTGLAAAIVLVDPTSPSSHQDVRAPVRPAAEANVEQPAGATVRDAGDESAVDAALRFVRAPQEWLFLSAADLDQVLREELTPDATSFAARLTAEADEARRGLAGTTGTVWFTIAPLAWRVESSSASAAVVSVWAVTVLSAPGVAASQADWSTTRVRLERVRGRWRLAGFDDRPGPTPQPGATDAPWTTDQFGDALDGFQRVGVS